MKWLDVVGIRTAAARLRGGPLVSHERVLAALHAARPDLVSCITVVALEGAGPDTDATVGEWLDRYRGAADRRAGRPRAIACAAIAASDLADAAAYARLVARLLRPGGVAHPGHAARDVVVPAGGPLVGVDLSRGHGPRHLRRRAPTVRFLSNKRGYSATFGRDLMEAGFDPRDVMDKAAIATHRRAGDRRALRSHVRAAARRLAVVTAAAGAGRWRPAKPSAAISKPTLDLVLWIDGARAPSSAAVSSTRRRRARRSRRAARRIARNRDVDDAHRGSAVTARTACRSSRSAARIGPPDAERAELTNLAARHLHTLRGRLNDADAIVTAAMPIELRRAQRVSAGMRPTSRRPSVACGRATTKVAG